jgi:hypothetical protein
MHGDPEAKGSVHVQVAFGPLTLADARQLIHRWKMRPALPDGIMPTGYSILWQQTGGYEDGTFVAV